ncbi:AsmA family protein [Zoogloea sp.]|uniref:AsmA family protein n=1 Tax=Zoogloea sp. TaxID=49181 RepID=UPI00260A38F0|nr:AsmA family protein [Zoogloea sp.]MDD3353373.1 AsmA family protein [Zoogloea sp.]
MDSFFFRYLAFLLGGISTVSVAGALYLHATFDGVRLAAELSQFVRQHYQRTLRIEGAAELSLFPRLEIRLPEASLSIPDGSEEFAGIDGARICVRLWPLLTRRLAVEGLVVEGLRLNLRHAKDGRLNMVDLLETEVPEGASPFELELDWLQILGGRLDWRDGQGGQYLMLTDLEVDTGSLARQAQGRLRLSARVTRDEPASDARIVLRSDYLLEGPRRLLRKVDVGLKGALAGRSGMDLEIRMGELALSAGEYLQIRGGSFLLKGRRDRESFVLKTIFPELQFGAEGAAVDALDLFLRLEGPGEEGSLRLQGGGLKAAWDGIRVERIDGEVDWKGARGRLMGTLGGAADMQYASRVAELSGWHGVLRLVSESGPPVAFRLSGDAHVDGRRGRAEGRLAGTVNASTLEGRWRISRFVPLALGFDLALDRLTLPGVGEAIPVRDKSRPWLMDGSLAGGVDLDGVLRVGRLTVGKIRAHKVHLPIRREGGTLAFPAHSAELYGGRYDGSLSFQAEGRKMAYRGYLQNVTAREILADLELGQRFGGTTNIFAELETSGELPEDWLGNLQGVARLRLRNGTVGGINVLAALREWRDSLMQRRPSRRADKEDESTFVGEATASFQIARGVARSQDIQAVSRLLRLQGGGGVFLPERRLDLQLKATPLGFPVGPESALLVGLKGMSVPVRVKASPGALEWHLEPAAILPAAVGGGRKGGRRAVGALPGAIRKNLPRLVQPSVTSVERHE